MPVKFDPKQNDLLLSSQCRQNLDPNRLISLLPIRPYYHVADIGCGPGYFTIPLAKYLFDGKVYALDVQQAMLNAVKKEITIANLTNTEILRSNETKLPLEDESLNGALVAFVLQEASNRKALLEEIKRCLKKSGWVMILEWNKHQTDEGPPIKQRIDEKRMRTMTAKAGFRLKMQRDINNKQYMTLLRK